ncbi:hypothetical protein Z043_111109 [Scleropages formosus]|uniref:Uncharacterized protein n=1 Tax=Scleropages formosus TaxID=113540 RepID=A0A0N8JZR7_SCLFO|nr:hypothetical protein Z043_111109 [Scleropages formosus]
MKTSSKEQRQGGDGALRWLGSICADDGEEDDAIMSIVFLLFCVSVDSFCDKLTVVLRSLCFFVC